MVGGYPTKFFSKKEGDKLKDFNEIVEEILNRVMEEGISENDVTLDSEDRYGLFFKVRKGIRIFERILKEMDLKYYKTKSIYPRGYTCFRVYKQWVL